MKIIKSISVLSLLLFIGFATSCTTKDEALDPALPRNQVATSNSTTNPTPTQNGTFTVDFDGQTYSANNITAVKQVVTANGISVSSYSIIANSINGTNGKNITINLLEEDPSNNYQTGLNSSNPVGDGNVSYISDILNAQQTTFQAINTANPFTTTGLISVTSNNATTQKISGTFSCTVYRSSLATPQIGNDSKVFTNGVFTNIYYTII